MGPTETGAMTDTKRKRIARLSARWRQAFTSRTGIKPWASMGSVLTQRNVNGFILSPLPELGTMGSKWGGAWATGSSTSSKAIKRLIPDTKMHTPSIFNNLGARSTGYALQRRVFQLH